MARTATVVQVLVSSPSDLAREREALEVLIMELNKTWSKQLGVMFELLRWETDVRPAAGVDPQAVINAQIIDNYDVFIGMLWGRFGTPTPRTSSGTLEEFEHAMARVRTDGGTKPEVMIYFKDAPLHPSKIDPHQLKHVHDFRESLTEQGVLFSTFEDEAGFQNSVRAHLASLAQSYSNHSNKSSAPNTPSADEADEIDDLGYFDYVEIYTSRMEDMNSTLNSISTATVRIGDQVQSHGNDIRQLDVPHKNTKNARGYVKKAADDMDSYAAIVRRQLPLLSESRDEALSALTNALALYQEFGEADEEDLVDLRGSLASMQAAAAGAKEGMGTFYESIAAIPRLSSELNRAKKAVLAQVDVLLSDIDKTISTVQNILDSIDRMIAQ